VFWVVNHRQAPAAAGEILFVTDGWNDRFLWVTQFFVTVVNNLGERIDVGEVKIARAGMAREKARASCTGIHKPVVMPLNHSGLAILR